MLGRICELKEANTLFFFLEYQERDKLLQSFKNNGFQLRLLYLADISEAFNTVNLTIQGTYTNMFAIYDITDVLTSKRHIWLQRLGIKNVASTSRLDKAFDSKIHENYLKENIKSHLVCPQDE
jgi:hypothetical protein